MKATIARLMIVLGAVALVGGATASADESALGLRARLLDFDEVPPTATGASGMLTATVHINNTITFTLTYQGLSTPAFMAHFHFAQPRVNGGVFIWLCGDPATTPAKQACPPGTTTPATVTGTITAADVRPVQGIKAGDFATVLRIIEADRAYVNVHTSMFPNGEIRGQVSTGDSNSD